MVRTLIHARMLCTTLSKENAKLGIEHSFCAAIAAGLTMQHDSALCANTQIRTGVLCIILCFALGISNLFHASLILIFSIICLYVLSYMLP